MICRAWPRCGDFAAQRRWITGVLRPVAFPIVTDSIRWGRIAADPAPSAPNRNHLARPHRIKQSLDPACRPIWHSAPMDCACVAASSEFTRDRIYTSAGQERELRLCERNGRVGDTTIVAGSQGHHRGPANLAGMDFAHTRATGRRPGSENEGNLRNGSCSERRASKLAWDENWRPALPGVYANIDQTEARHNSALERTMDRRPHQGAHCRSTTTARTPERKRPAPGIISPKGWHRYPNSSA